MDPREQARQKHVDQLIADIVAEAGRDATRYTQIDPPPIAVLRTGDTVVLLFNDLTSDPDADITRMLTDIQSWFPDNKVRFLFGCRGALIWREGDPGIVVEHCDHQWDLLHATGHASPYAKRCRKCDEEVRFW